MFGSMKNIEAASVPDLQELGISKTVAQTIVLTFQNSKPKAVMRKM